MDVYGNMEICMLVNRWRDIGMWRLTDRQTDGQAGGRRDRQRHS